MNELRNLLPKEFPSGLRVLLVEDDENSIQVIDQMLKSWHYQVTICRQANEALSILKDNKENYDIVMSDLHIHDMDGLKFIEIVGKKMNLPVVMITGDETHDVIIKGIINGACENLVKPISRDALKLIWQHVVRKKTKELKELEHMDSKFLVSNDVEEISKETDTCDSLKRKRDVDYESDQAGCDDVRRAKKPRLVWTAELHYMFVTAVNELGVDRAVPKKILESMQRMGVSNITRENIASHLQKYRMYLKRDSSNENTCSSGPNEHYFQQESYAFNEISRLQHGCGSSCPRVSQDNQLLNPSSSSTVGVFNDHHMKPFDTRVVVGSRYEMEQQFNNLDLVLPRNQQQQQQQQQEEEEDLILRNTVSQTFMTLPLKSENESNKEMMISGVMENESSSDAMYSSSQHVTPLTDMTCYHPTMEISLQSFPLQHPNHFVYRNECSIDHHLNLIEDHDFGNLGNNALQHNKIFLENRNAGFHPRNSLSGLSFVDPSIHHVHQQPLDIDDFRFLEESSEFAENITTPNGYSTDR